jgi:ribosomal protein S16
VEEVNKLLKQFIQMKKMLKSLGGMAGLAKGKRPNLSALERNDAVMVVIRLRRAGSKKRPFFRVVVTDSRAARDSSYVEVLGHLQPAHQAGDAEARSRASGALAEARRAAVRHGPHAVDRMPRRPRRDAPAAAASAS